MISMQALKLVGTRGVGRSLLVVKKFSPEILTAAGIAGGVVSAFLASKATLKLESVLDELTENVSNVKEFHEGHSSQSMAVYNKDVAKVYTHTAKDIIVLYGPAVSLGIVSIACIIGGHDIVRRRNLALVAAYKALETSFLEYRKRVVNEFGVEKDLKFSRGIGKEMVIDEKGKSKAVDVFNPNGISAYARFFDETCKDWTKTPEYNLLFVRAQQNFANDMLQSRGHLFLNEVYEALGMEQSQAGAVVGWILTPNTKQGDNFVDFGLYDLINEKAREFVNGYETSILLDFNVNGVIFDLI
jgi:Family of unknown function (DUF6353)